MNSSHSGSGPFDLLIRGGTLLTPNGLFDGDLAIRDGQIAGIAEHGSISGAAHVLEADGLTVLPGAIDGHVHFDEPGRSDWEGWASGSLAAAAGGVTTVLDMPIDSDPPTTRAGDLLDKRRLAESQSLVDFGLNGGLVDGDAARLAALVDAGAVALKAFLCDSGWEEFPPVDDAALAVGCALASERRLRLAVHCESPELLADGGPPHLARPASAEVRGVERLVAAAAPSAAPVHVVHASSAEAVLATRGAANVTVETCPHYLALDLDQVERIGAAAWCAPPIRSAENAEALWSLLGSGLIDSLASDHSPCPPRLKTTDPPFHGINGVETAFSAVWSTGRISLAALSALRTAAARIFGLPGKGALAVGYDADLYLLDPEAVWPRLTRLAAQPPPHLALPRRAPAGCRRLDRRRRPPRATAEGSRPTSRGGHASSARLPSPAAGEAATTSAPPREHYAKRA